MDGHECTGNTIYQEKPGEVFSIRDLRVHLLGKGECYTLPGFAAPGPVPGKKGQPQGKVPPSTQPRSAA